MSGHVLLLNLLYELGKSNKMQGQEYRSTNVRFFLSHDIKIT